MANTEKITCIKHVRVAIKKVRVQLRSRLLTAKEKSVLQRTLSQLERIEDQLILRDISKNVDSIMRESKKLTPLITQMKQAQKELEKTIAVVEKAAKAVKGLVDVSVAIAKSGVL